MENRKIVVYADDVVTLVKCKVLQPISDIIQLLGMISLLNGDVLYTSQTFQLIKKLGGNSLINNFIEILLTTKS